MIMIARDCNALQRPWLGVYVVYCLDLIFSSEALKCVSHMVACKQADDNTLRILKEHEPKGPKQIDLAAKIAVSRCPTERDTRCISGINNKIFAARQRSN